jgi:hypothetical protein
MTPDPSSRLRTRCCVACPPSATVCRMIDCKDPAKDVRFQRAPIERESATERSDRICDGTLDVIE